MRRLLAMLASTLLVAGLTAASAAAEFGFEGVDVVFKPASGGPPMQAGSHPREMVTKLDVNTVEPAPGVVVPDGSVRDLIVNLPAGFAGTPDPVPTCAAMDFLTIADGYTACPDSAALGIARTRASIKEPSPGVLYSPVYNLDPPPGVAAKIGFIALELPVTVEVRLAPDPPYNIVAAATNIAQVAIFYGSELTLWGTPADPLHDPLRGSCLQVISSGLDLPTSRGNCPVSLPQKPFFTLPRRCSDPLAIDFFARAWNTGETATATATTHDEAVPPNPLGTVLCSNVGSAPLVDAQPTTDQASSPSGLDFNLELDNPGLSDPAGTARSDIRKAVVTLPKGVTVNPSQAEGLAVCGENDLRRETANSEFGAGCPSASKIGSVEVETPLLEGEILTGSLFIAEPYANRFGSLLAIYMTIKSPRRGIVVKLAGRVDPDPRTGQLITTFDDLPQLPFSDFRLRFHEGARSPLVTPEGCGIYATESEFTPWADASAKLTTTSLFQISRGVGGGPCPPEGPPPFAPGFQAGSLDPRAGAHTPFYMRLTRRDGDQDLTRFSSQLPPGLLGRLAGLERCTDGAIAAAGERSGRDELAAPSCPAGSKIGRTLAGAGVGSQLTYVPGSLYLAGPYGGAPLSVVSITPAVAGPFDVGTVVVRVALRLNRVTGQVQTDGARSDPIPHILAGIPLKLRDLRVYADRERFILNPTRCAPFASQAILTGGGADPFSAADDGPVSLSSPFQVANCANLRFKPRIGFQLRGGTRRGDHPALRAVLRPRSGDANLRRAVVRLPRSAFLEQDHIRTVCTRVQFAADRCPKGSVYGRVTVFSPLLDEPLRGPVRLRSSSNLLPDLVFDLRGIVEVEAAARIDSIRGGIRATFTRIPDAPISKVVVRMFGGDRGLIVNSRNLCAQPKRNRAEASFNGQNGKRLRLMPVVEAVGCKRS